MRNGEAMRRGLTPCEWNPFGMRLSRLGEGFHAEAELVGGKLSKRNAREDRQLRVCRDCAAREEVQDYARTPGNEVRFREIEEEL